MSHRRVSIPLGDIPDVSHPVSDAGTAHPGSHGNAPSPDIHAGIPRTAPEGSNNTSSHGTLTLTDPEPYGTCPPAPRRRSSNAGPSNHNNLGALRLKFGMTDGSKEEVSEYASTRGKVGYLMAKQEENDAFIKEARAKIAHLEHELATTKDQLDKQRHCDCALAAPRPGADA